MSDSTSRGDSVALPACIVSPALTEGPFFVDGRLNRSDIRSNPADGVMREGIPLHLRLNVFQIRGGSCTALPDAAVDIWQCDAMGIYSDVVDASSDTIGQQFLRGCQITGDNGVAQFTTIYPGWYEGRTVHIHFKIRLQDAGGRHQEHTSQLFFDDELTDRVHAREPYASKGMRTVRNAGDSIYLASGDLLTLDVVPDETGYTATHDIGLLLD